MLWKAENGISFVWSNNEGRYWVTHDVESERKVTPEAAAAIRQNQDYCKAVALPPEFSEEEFNAELMQM